MFKCMKIVNFFSSEHYESEGIEVVENTPDEITALAIEMDERINERWEERREDEELQQQFWAFYKQYISKNVFSIRIGKEFLKQNKKWLLG